MADHAPLETKPSERTWTGGSRDSLLVVGTGSFHICSECLAGKSLRGCWSSIQVTGPNDSPGHGRSVPSVLGARAPTIPPPPSWGKEHKEVAEMGGQLTQSLFTPRERQVCDVVQTLDPGGGKR